MNEYDRSNHAMLIAQGQMEIAHELAALVLRARAWIATKLRFRATAEALRQ
jgi:hypothetical protein